MKKVLITGAGGFIGSHLTEQCVELGFQVRAFVHYNSKNEWGWLEESEYKNEIEIHSGDIRDYDSVKAAVSGMETVFHLAALVGIPYSYVSPLAYIKTNIEGTYNILQAAKESGVDSVLTTSTSETYGTAQYVPMDEKHPLTAQSPYAASKIAADQLALSYCRSFGMNVKIIRPFNAFGPRQSLRAIIPTIIAQVLDGQSSLKLGNLSPTRDFTFVKDTVRGFIDIAGCSDFSGEVVNIGTNEEHSISAIIGMISDNMGVQIPVQLENQRKRPNESEVDRLKCDNSKLIQRTHWKPDFDFETGLSITIDWMKEHLQRTKATIYNL